MRIRDIRQESNKSNRLKNNKEHLLNPLPSFASSVDRVLYLQRTIGNRAVTRLIEAGALQVRSETDRSDVPGFIQTVKNLNDPCLHIQRTPVDTAFGKFKDHLYQDKTISTLKVGVKMHLKFDPGKFVDAKKIGLVQSVRSYAKGKDIIRDPHQQRQRLVKKGPGKGYQIDRDPYRNNPVYGSRDLPSGQGLEKTPMSSAPSGQKATAGVGGNSGYQLGYRYRGGKGAFIKQEAWLYDEPKIPGVLDSGQIFETTAVAIDGTQKGMYYGSVKWGWKVDNRGNFTRIPLTLASRGVPTQNFLAAAEKWNKATTAYASSIETRGNTTFYLDSGRQARLNLLLGKSTPSVTLKGGTRVILQDDVIVEYRAGKVFTRVLVNAGTHVGKIGFVRPADLKEKSSGMTSPTVDLPMVDVHYINADKVSLVADPGRLSSTRKIPVSKKTRVKISDKGVGKPFNRPNNLWWKVVVVDGPKINNTGWVKKGFLTDERP